MAQKVAFAESNSISINKDFYITHFIYSYLLLWENFSALLQEYLWSLNKRSYLLSRSLVLLFFMKKGSF